MITNTEDMTDAWGETWSEDDRVGLGPAPTVTSDDLRPVLTGRQAMVVAAIHGLTIARGVAPTLRDVSEATGIKNRNGVWCHVAPLVRKGYLRRPRPLLSRDLVLLPPPPLTEVK